MTLQKFKTRVDLLASIPIGSSIAEVGVWRGYLSNEILSLPNFKRVVLVDSWRRRDDYSDPLADAETNHEANYKETLKNISGHKHGGRYQILRLDSLVAANSMEDDALNCVYLDGNHSYDACLADLIAWSRVVGPHGYLCGHDHTENEQAKKWGFGVVPAVRDFCKKYGWQITGLDEEEFQSFRLQKIHG